MRPSRREFLKRSAALPLIGAVGAADIPPSLIVRETQPENLETPFAALDGFLTPTDRFYVRSHFPVPSIDAASWRLKVEGAVGHPLELGLGELKRLGERTMATTLECAGNGRAFLVPTARGVQWGLGAVGTAEWTGVPLASVLERAGIKAEAVDVILEGSDQGDVRDDPRAPNPVKFARAVPAERARGGDVLLAWAMNGRPLTAAHGAPVRAIVPGWYGMAAVKWLARVVATERPFRGFFQEIDYAYWERRDGLPVRTPLTEIEVKASIARPALREVVPAESSYRVRGAAWAGTADVAKVELSTDGGRSWSVARLVGEPRRFAWRLWEADWRVPAEPGRRTLLARATDSRGRTQPDRHDRDRGGYMINFTVPVTVEVRRAAFR